MSMGSAFNFLSYVVIQPEPELTVPSAPTNIAAQNSDSEVTLFWNAPLSDGGTPIVKYSVKYNNGTNWPVQYTNANTTNTTFTNLVNDQTYTFNLHAHNAVGYSTETAFIMGTPSGE